eukprot:3728521-Pleurochrysis_carterae.AAC.7
MAHGIEVHHYESLTKDVRVFDFLQAVGKKLNKACQSHPLPARQLRRRGLKEKTLKKKLSTLSIELGEDDGVAALRLRARYAAVELGYVKQTLSAQHSSMRRGGLHLPSGLLFGGLSLFLLRLQSLCVC